jgi:IS5 family transposase
VARNARRAGARRSGDGRLGRLVGELAETIAATERLLAQTDQRLAGNRVIPDRLVSLSDLDARPIRKGSPSIRPSSVTRCWWPKTSALCHRPPAPAGQPAGRSPARRHPRQGPACAGADPSLPQDAQLASRDRARISQLKRGFGLRRSRLRRLPGAKPWVGLGVFAYNLQRLTVTAR